MTSVVEYQSWFKKLGNKNWGNFYYIKQFKKILRIEVEKKEYMNVEVGNGPVNALDKALRKSLMGFFQMRIVFDKLLFKCRKDKYQD